MLDTQEELDISITVIAMGALIALRKRLSKTNPELWDVLYQSLSESKTIQYYANQAFKYATDPRYIHAMKTMKGGENDENNT